MFGIGVGELALALIVVFLIAPRELPRVLRTIGHYIGAAERIRRDWYRMERDVRDIVVSVEDEGDTVVPKEGIEGETPAQGR